VAQFAWTPFVCHSRDSSKDRIPAATAATSVAKRGSLLIAGPERGAKFRLEIGHNLRKSDFRRASDTAALAKI
jgi:hypothetical protein